MFGFLGRLGSRAAARAGYAPPFNVLGADYWDGRRRPAMDAMAMLGREATLIWAETGSGADHHRDRLDDLTRARGQVSLETGQGLGSRGSNIGAGRRRPRAWAQPGTTASASGGAVAYREVGSHPRASDGPPVTGGCQRWQSQPSRGSRHSKVLRWKPAYSSYREGAESGGNADVEGGRAGTSTRLLNLVNYFLRPPVNSLSEPHRPVSLTEPVESRSRVSVTGRPRWVR